MQGKTAALVVKDIDVRLVLVVLAAAEKTRRQQVVCAWSRCTRPRQDVLVFRVL
jgi:hypothetical protein